MQAISAVVWGHWLFGGQDADRPDLGILRVRSCGPDVPRVPLSGHPLAWLSKRPHYLNSVSAADSTQIPLSLLFLETKAATA
jgi:hypothetical protein